MAFNTGASFSGSPSSSVAVATAVSELRVFVVPMLSPGLVLASMRPPTLPAVWSQALNVRVTSPVSSPPRTYLIRLLLSSSRALAALIAASPAVTPGTKNPDPVLNSQRPAGSPPADLTEKSIIATCSPAKLA